MRTSGYMSYRERAKAREENKARKESVKETLKKYDVLFNDISKALADVDKKILGSSLNEIDDILSKMDEARKNRDTSDRYWIYTLYNICGGKGNYDNVYSDRPKPMIEEIIRKRILGNIEARNLKIASKLYLKTNSISVDTAMAETKTGFSGTYTLDTDDGKYWLRIEVIVAGGYNIQCAHYRTLVHIGKM